MKRMKLPVKPVVLEALMRLPVVEVAFTWKSAFLSGVVVEPMITERVVVGARKLVFAISKVLPKGVAVESAAQPNFPAPS